jgi:hypothetical protein
MECFCNNAFRFMHSCKSTTKKRRKKKKVHRRESLFQIKIYKSRSKVPLNTRCRYHSCLGILQEILQETEPVFLSIGYRQLLALSRSLRSSTVVGERKKSRNVD